MLYHSAVALSQMPTDAEMAEGRVFPRIETIRECSYHVAVAVAKHALEENLARAGPGRCLLYTSPSPRDLSTSRMPSSA